MLKLEHLTLNDRAYSKIKQGLISGKFAPGEPLIIRKLAETYGISTTPIREALQRLVAERGLEMAQNRSIVVPLLTLATFEELTTIRVANEGVAAEIAARKFSGEALAETRGLLKSMERAISAGDGRLYITLNESFHFAIYSQANTPILFNIVRDLWVRVGPYLSFLLEADSYVPQANDAHLKIFEALERRDGVAARVFVEQDITRAATVLRGKLEALPRHSVTSGYGDNKQFS